MIQGWLHILQHNHHLLPAVVPSPFHLYMFLSTPQSILPLSFQQSVLHTLTQWVFFTKAISGLIFTLGKRRNSLTWSHHGPSSLSVLITCLVSLLILRNPHILAFVRHLIIIPSTERILCMRFSCLWCLPLLFTELILTYASYLSLIIISSRKPSLTPPWQSQAPFQRTTFCYLVEKTTVAVFPFNLFLPPL